MVQLGYLFLLIVQLIVNLKNKPEAVEKVGQGPAGMHRVGDLPVAPSATLLRCAVFAVRWLCMLILLSVMASCTRIQMAHA